MEHLSQFIINHMALSAAFIVVLVGIFILEARTAAGPTGSRLTPQLVTQMMNNEMAIVIDIRDGNAFRDGHIIGSINVPLSEWDSHLNKIEKFHDKPVIIVDAAGQKAVAQISKLTKSGFEQVKMLGGGIQAWRSEKLPLVRGKK